MGVIRLSKQDRKMTKEELDSLGMAYGHVQSAKLRLQEAVKQLAEFGEDVPKLNSKALDLFLNEVKELDFSMGFIKSFISVSVLTQIVPREET
jgi:hypothetical protein